MPAKAKKKPPTVDDMSNTEVLRAAMRQHGLTREELAAQIDVSPHTVDSWLRPDGSAAHRQMPDRMRRLLLMTLPVDPAA